MSSSNIIRFSLSYLLSLPLAISLGLIAGVQAQNVTTPENQPEVPTEDLTDPNNLRPLTREDSLLSLQGGKKLIAEANQAVNSQQYDTAAEKLQQARQIFNQLSNFHIQLSSSFSGIDNRIAETERKKALETGQMRDEATYQLALVHRAQNKPELSVPLLIQVIRSQNPTSELGKKSYQQLFEIGFVEEPASTANTSK
jgi:hypothetical protein